MTTRASIHAHTCFEVIDLLFGVVRKECVLEALQVQGINEDSVRGAIAWLQDLRMEGAPPPPRQTRRRKR